MKKQYLFLILVIYLIGCKGGKTKCDKLSYST